MTTPLQFAPFVSTVDNAFFPALFALKLDHDKLDESARGVVGLYKPELVRTADSNKMLMLGNAFRNQAAPRESVRAEGILKNVNTLGAFEKADRTAMMKTAGRQIWDAINDSSIYSVPSLLSSFIILCHTDQKKHEVSYWFAFPTLQSNPPWKRSGPIENLTADESTALVDEVGTWRLSVDGREHGFFLARKVRGAKPSTEDEDEGDEAAQRLPYRWEIASLRRFEQGFFNNIPEEDRYVAFVDPSTFPEGPGWSLRNLLILIRQRFHLNKVKILCYRDIHARRDQPRSIILPIEAEHLPNVGLAEMPTVMGWEKKDGKLEAQKVTLQANEETNLADASVDLNLKLMKWRLAPDLDLDKIKNTKCLLLGAGTLGGYVARNLLGWGVRKVTFVDYGKVSYSNPVRQPLFEFSDCAGGGKQKAEQAAEMLKRIYPGVDSKGVNMEVPMLGHPFINEVKARGSYDTLKSLIQEHDVIFLLMDTRESRWLPTVMGKAEGKIVMNAALGFDSYVVMRHGAEGKAEKDTPALGCYYCNDVVAPTDSTRDVTLDQQCTVTRPGVAAIASALLVEVLTSLLQHPLLNHAPAPQPTPGHIPERDPPNHPLGLVPHQIRGWVSTFQNMVIRGHAYDCCSACSPKILDAYRTDGWEFVKRALLDKEYVAELSGLAELHRQAEKLDADLDWDEEDNGLAADEGDGELL